MSNYVSSTRWWESYLVRYLMPSIAGVAIVSWLSSVAAPGFREILFLHQPSHQLDLPTLTLLILYGNLFCYVASYPILSFHVTRVVDFINFDWRPSFIDGYLATLGLGIAALILSVFFSGKIAVCLAFFLVFLFAIIQLLRLWRVRVKRPIRGFNDATSIAYGYTYALSKRRGIVDETKTISSHGDTASAPDLEDLSSEEVTRTSRWRSEVVDTYRHMREHGNSAFIFFLELILAALCYAVVSATAYSAHEQLSLLGILLALWALPSVFVHLLGQHLERRFSLFDRRL